MMIRQMQQEDLQKVSDLENACFSMPWLYHDFETALQKDYYIFIVAEENGEIIGQAGLIQSLDEADLTNVAVATAYRNQKIASQMLEYLLQLGFAKGIRAFTLEVRESNTAALALYEKFGFVKEGIRKDFYDKPKENAVIMWKRCQIL